MLGLQPNACARCLARRLTRPCARPQFAATACTIVSGAIAERARFESYVLYTSFMAAWVYPIVTHASWSPSSYIGMFRWASHALISTSIRHRVLLGCAHATAEPLTRVEK